MRVLMTTDAVGGVWQYSAALARGLVELHECEILLVCLGGSATEDSAEGLPERGVEVVPLDVKLEWMPGAADDVGRGLEEMERLVRSWSPDVLHSNQFCFGLLETAVPKVVVAHSDVLSWVLWHRRGGDLRAVAAASDQAEGRKPRPARDSSRWEEWLESYRRVVVSGLAGAQAVVCPSRFMARSLKGIYGADGRVIYNGLWPDLYAPSPKVDRAVVAGRLWDEAKRAETAVRAVEGLPLELRMIGPTEGAAGEAVPRPSRPNVHYTGRLSWRDTVRELASARFYLATSSYEPFGLAALEAALCGCTLVANDIPSYREIWGDAALFYRRDDALDLHRCLTQLLEDGGRAGQLAARARERAMAHYTADRMAEDYHRLYWWLSTP